MTLNIKTGDWAVLRNGFVEGPVIIAENEDFPIYVDIGNIWNCSTWTIEGFSKSPHNPSPRDIIATLPCPPLERIRQLEEALRFYAKPGNHTTSPEQPWSDVEIDYGEKARRALGESK